METLSTQPLPSRLILDKERDELMQEQHRLVQANQLVLEELRHTLTITHMLIGKSHILTLQWERSKEKCR